MKQALHIFRKDVRRLWPHIAALMVAILYFSFLDIRWSVLRPNSVPSRLIEFIVGAAVWFLLARAVHEESLPGDNQFWLTRPYERRSLLLSKVLMVVLVVGVPLFAADCVILSVQSLSVGGNFGGLILRQFVTAAWLILPPFAIASVTRTITEDVMAWLVAFAIAGAGYFEALNIHPLGLNQAIPVAIVLMLATLWRQYSRPGTKAGRALIAAAIVMPVLPFPQSAALAIVRLRSNPAAESISVTVAAEGIEKLPARSDFYCTPIAVSVTGVLPGWRLAVSSQQDTFESRGGAAAGGKVWSTGWRSYTGGAFADDFNQSQTAGNVFVCPPTAGLRELGVGEPLSVRVSLVLAVYNEDPPVRIAATLKPFEIPGVGRCQFQYYFGGDKYVLACKSPVWTPRQGRVVMVTQDSWSSQISFFTYPWTPMDLLPGLSPVFKWVTLPMDSQIRDAVASGGQLEFRPETPIAFLRREVTAKGLTFRTSD